MRSWVGIEVGKVITDVRCMVMSVECQSCVVGVFSII